ncbi:MAG: sulfatase-like hydrolase/transferase [Kiritimatiellaeota bacterium]|nr:sulfatase-like hydrolase/transferase [Kiritimatiellota bacterium]
MTTRRDFLKLAGYGAVGAALCPRLGKTAEPAFQSLENKSAKRPNIIFILADDLGFEALGCYGGVTYKGLGPVKTPHLDAMAKGGMLFKQCFACPVCSPARSEVLTGKYNFRVGFRRILSLPGVAERLDHQAHPTVALRLKEAGYVTAVVGKWHLGPPFTKGKQIEEIPKSADADTDYPHPRDCGFDRQCIFSGGHLSTYGEPKPGKYTPELLQKWTLNFIESRKGKPEPFFVYYASPIPHGPLYPTPLNPDGAPGKGDNKNFPYLIEYLDKQVGELLEKLTALGLRENTLVMFAGDNGTYDMTTIMRDGREVRGGKGSPADTGAWVPLLANWPGVVAAGSVYEGLVDFTDILPTCVELAGATPHAGVDGVSFAPQLRGQPGKPREWIFVLGGDRWYARDAKWKLNNTRQLLDVSNSPYAETLVKPEDDTPESKAARARLQAVLD